MQAVNFGKCGFSININIPHGIQLSNLRRPMSSRVRIIIFISSNINSYNFIVNHLILILVKYKILYFIISLWQHAIHNSVSCVGGQAY